MDNNYDYNSIFNKGKKNTPPANTELAKKAAYMFRNKGYDDIPIDVFGAYTGMSYDGDTPDQDADDL